MKKNILSFISGTLFVFAGMLLATRIAALCILAIICSIAGYAFMDLYAYEYNKK